MTFFEQLRPLLTTPAEHPFWRWLLVEGGWQEALAAAGQRTAAGWEPKMMEAVTRLWREAADPTAEVDAVIAAAEGRLHQVLDGAYGDIGRTLTGEVAKRVAAWSGALPVGWDIDLQMLTPELVTTLAERHAAQLVRHVGPQVRTQVRRHVTEALSEGVHPTVLARRLRRVVPLLPQQESSVARLEAQAAADGLPPRRARAMADRYAAQLAGHRALTIARTEMLAASNGATMAAWSQRLEEGLIPAGTLRAFVISRDCLTCPQCRQMTGERALAPLGVPFQFPDGKGGYRETMAPPVGTHPRCRCTVALVVPAMLTQAEYNRIVNPKLPAPCPPRPRRAGGRRR